MGDNITVLCFKPGCVAEVQDMPNTLEELQSFVGGYIEIVPLERGAVLICNDEGKVNGMKFCRAIVDYSGVFMDAIFGPFIIAGEDNNDNLKSLTRNQISTYLGKYKHAEKLSFTGDGLPLIMKLDSEDSESEGASN